MFQFLELNSRRSQRGFDGVNLHSPTLMFSPILSGVALATALTPVENALTAADPSRIGASPSVVLDSRSHVIAASFAWRRKLKLKAKVKQD